MWQYINIVNERGRIGDKDSGIADDDYWIYAIATLDKIPHTPTLYPMGIEYHEIRPELLRFQQHPP